VQIVSRILGSQLYLPFLNGCRIVLETEGSVIAGKVSSAHGMEGATSLAEQVGCSHDISQRKETGSFNFLLHFLHADFSSSPNDRKRALGQVSSHVMCFSFWGGDGVWSVLLCFRRDNAFLSLAMAK
jgi:hypothetical protein